MICVNEHRCFCCCCHAESFIMATLWNRAGHYIFALWFLSSFFSSPNLSGWRLDVYHTSTQCKFRMHVWNVLHAALWNTGCKNRHFGTIAQLCQAVPSQLRHVSTIGKNLLNIDTSSTRPHNLVNFGLLMAEVCWRVWGTTGNFNGFRVLAALLHGTLVVGVSQTAALNRGRHLYLAGRPSRLGIGPHSSMKYCFGVLLVANPLSASNSKQKI